MSSPRIEIYRHGEAYYQQGITILDEASDLTTRGKETIHRNGHETFVQNDRLRRIQIFSSPYGRALETAKIIRQEFKDNNLPIYPRRCLQEQINFSYSTINILCKGGVWKDENGVHLIDPTLTNPLNLNQTEYNLSEALKIDPENWLKLPTTLTDRLRSMETSEKIQARIIRFIKSLSQKMTSTDLSIVVTHDALIALFLATAKSETTHVEPGNKVIIEVVNQRLHILSVAGYLPRKVPSINLI